VHIYPTVNWWRGNLRQHESYLSLVVRFAHLNDIRLGQACMYLDDLLGNRTEPGEADLTRLADSLSEDRTTLQSVIREPVKLTPCLGTLLPHDAADGSLRYCEQCAAAGYHSYLHEYRWLARCPLHNTQLQVVWPSTRTGSSFVRTGNALAHVMSTACPEWPMAPPMFQPDVFEGLAWLVHWVVSAAAKARQLTEQAIWSSETTIFRDSSDFRKAIGEMHALEPIQPTMAPMFVTFDRDCVRHVRHFSPAAAASVAQMAMGSLKRLFSIYQRLAPYAEPPNLAAVALAACRDQLKARHLQCRCRWGRETLGWTTRWVPVHQEDWPLSMLTCPNAVACEALELAVGRRYEYLSSRREYEERLSLTTDACSVAKQGLATWEDETEMSDENLTYSTKDVWRSIHWVGNAGLNEVFEAVACAEIESVQQALLGWLDSIDAGRHPARYTSPGRKPQLCLAAEAMYLVTWTWHGGRNVQ
jgi:hypothetical protein